MAPKPVVLLEDDLDGGTADETVTFALDGVQYEMDLSTANAAGLRELLAPYIGAGRRIGGRTVTHRRVGGGGPARPDREQLAAIRAWARSRGLQIKPVSDGQSVHRQVPPGEPHPFDIDPPATS